MVEQIEERRDDIAPCLYTHSRHHPSLYKTGTSRSNLTFPCKGPFWNFQPKGGCCWIVPQAERRPVRAKWLARFHGIHAHNWSWVFEVHPCRILLSRPGIYRGLVGQHDDLSMRVFILWGRCQHKSVHMSSSAHILLKD